MTPMLSLITVLAAAAPQAPAVSQAAIGPATTVSPAATEGVTSYPASFFAGAKATTALDMVQRLPGFQVDLGSTVRGFEGAAGNVLVDGARPVSKTDQLDEILRRIPAGQVDHIEIIRGGAPGIDMQGKSILANVVRAKGAGFQGVFALANNHSLDDGRNKVGIRFEGSGQLGPGAWEGSTRYGEGYDDGAGDGPHTVLGPTGQVRDQSSLNTRGDVHQWTTTGAYELPVLGGKLRVNGRGFWDYYRYTEYDYAQAPLPSVAFDHDRQDRIQSELGALYSRSFGERLQLELVGLRQTQDLTYISDFMEPGDSSHFALQKDTEERILRAVGKYRLSDSVSLEVGGENALNTLDGATELSVNGSAIPLPAGNVHVEEDRSEAFGKAVWRPSAQWTLEGGIRYETSAIASSGDVVLSKDLRFAKPRLLVSWTPREGSQIRARYERAVGQLNFDDFVAANSSLSSGAVTTGNPDLNPEQAWVSELAVEQAFWTKGSATLTVRHFELSDVVDRAPVFANGRVFDAPANIGDGTKDELQFDLTLPLDRLGITGGLLRGTSTWRRSAVTDPTTRAEREISNLQPIAWEAHFTQDLARISSTLGVDVFGGWSKTAYRFDEIYIQKQLKPWSTIYVEYKPRPDLAVRVEVSNDLGRGFSNTRQKYAGPRGSNPLTYTDDRRTSIGQGFFMRVRKTFG